ATTIRNMCKQKHRRAALTGVGLDLALFLDTRTQNAPSRIAPTIAKAANTASTSSRKARSKSHPPFRGRHCWQQPSLAKESAQLKAPNVLRCRSRPQRLAEWMTI